MVYCLNRMIARPAQSGFSLVELSIVLVILGLLTGGILAGQSLIRAAELRAVSTEYNRYVTAVQTFRDKYFATPGDMANATSFWGAAHATPATCATTASTTIATCNGDGNGSVVPTANSYEQFRFWQHLANAGLIEGSYSGTGTAFNVATDMNSPRSRLGNGLWYTITYSSQVSGNADLLDGSYGSILTAGAAQSGTIPYGPTMKPEELWNIDTKMDDGRPGTGKVGFYGYGTVASCSTAANSATANPDYRLDSSAIACAPLWRNAY